MSDNTALKGVSGDTTGDAIQTHDTTLTDGSGRSIKTPASLIRQIDPNGIVDTVKGNVFDGTANIVAGGFNQGFTVYSNVTTDLEGFRDDFNGTSLQQSAAGTVTFTNGGSTITGSGTNFVSAFNTCDIYVRLSTDPDSDLTKLLYQPYYRGTATLAYLLAGYPGTSGSGTATWSYWFDSVGSGGSIAVGSGAATTSEVAIQSGTTNASGTYIQHGTHYVPPCMVECRCRLDKLVSGTESGFGLVDVPGLGNSNVQISVVLGPGPTNVTLRTGNTSTVTESNTFSLPAGSTVLQHHQYKLICSVREIQIFVDDIFVGRNKTHLPSFYSPQPLSIWQYNTQTASTSSSLIVDGIVVVSHDQVMIEPTTSAASMPSEITGLDGAGTLQKSGVVGYPANAARHVLVDTTSGNPVQAPLRNGLSRLLTYDEAITSKLDDALLSLLPFLDDWRTAMAALQQLVLNTDMAARASKSLPTTNLDGQLTTAMCDTAGRMIVRQAGARERMVVNNLTLSATGSNTLIAAGATGVFRDLTFLGLSNTSTSVVRVDVSDGTRTYSWALAPNGGGLGLNWAPPLIATSSATAWTVALSASVTDVRVSVQAVETN